MPKQDIIGGLKSALERGESLRQAMITFYNAGYKKEEIEEAARALHEQGETFPTTPEKPIPEKPTQLISSYEPKPKKQASDKSITLLIIGLLILLVLLAGVFLFREQVIEFFEGLFS